MAVKRCQRGQPLGLTAVVDVISAKWTSPSITYRKDFRVGESQCSAVPRSKQAGREMPEPMGARWQFGKRRGVHNDAVDTVLDLLADGKMG